MAKKPVPPSTERPGKPLGRAANRTVAGKGELEPGQFVMDTIRPPRPDPDPPKDKP